MLWSCRLCFSIDWKDGGNGRARPGAVLSVLALRNRVEPPAVDGDLSTIRGVLPMALVDELQRRLPTLTAGEGVLESRFAGYEPASRATSRSPEPPRHAAG